MPKPLTKDDFFTAAMELLATEGFAGLKQAALCRALRVTTGSFYNHFENWPAFKSQLLKQWRERRTVQLIELAQFEDDPIQRLDKLREVTVQLPHQAEAAIRVWSLIDPEVAAVQREVDAQRLGVIHAAMQQLFSDPDLALRYAHHGMYLLVGFQQLEAGDDPAYLDWSLSAFLDALKDRRDR